jgi:hypothetical protein
VVAVVQLANLPNRSAKPSNRKAQCDRQRRSDLSVTILLLVGCGTNPSGLTRSEAETVLRRDGYTDPAIGGSTRGLVRHC